MSGPSRTKRLHISGLTPSITQADLERRLSSFGQVKAMDGFGARDALGDPRKFAFVTMEIGEKELARCLNVLSGSTWKGAKLRLGEAKPDFRERLAQINSQPSQPVRPRRMCVRDHGHTSSTLPLVPLSAAAAASTPGWTVTPSGRVVRPMRMRPERPLEPMRGELSTFKVRNANGKTKKRIKPPPVRARRRLIDPTKWDSVYLKGMYLDAVPVLFPTSKDALEPIAHGKHVIVDGEDEEEGDKDDTNSDAFSDRAQPVPPLGRDYARTTVDAELPEAIVTTSRMTEFIDVQGEANAALAMVGKMFGDKEDWDGKEYIDEMDDIEDNRAKDDEMQLNEEDGVEIVPLGFGESEGRKSIEKDKGKGKEKLAGGADHSSHEDKADMEAALDGDMEMGENDAPGVEMSTQRGEPVSRTNLKALFAPREDAPFSLVDHLDLDLDLELDADILGIGAPSGSCQENENGHLPQPTLSVSQVVGVPTTKSAGKARSQVMLDPSHPLLFPMLDSLPYPCSSSSPKTGSHQHGAPPCFLFPSASRVRGLRHLPPSITFARSSQDTSESIRERWENDKSSLTREWKKAWRDARGSRRGRMGAGGEIGGGY